jgi:hypothetical protein
LAIIFAGCRKLRLNNIPIRPLNPPFWGTSEPFKVPQNKGFRGLGRMSISL